MRPALLTLIALGLLTLRVQHIQCSCTCERLTHPTTYTREGLIHPRCPRGQATHASRRPRPVCQALQRSCIRERLTHPTVCTREGPHPRCPRGQDTHINATTPVNSSLDSHNPIATPGLTHGIHILALVDLHRRNTHSQVPYTPHAYA